MQKKVSTEQRERIADRVQREVMNILTLSKTLAFPLMKMRREYFYDDEGVPAWMDGTTLGINVFHTAVFTDEELRYLLCHESVHYIQKGHIRAQQYIFQGNPIDEENWKMYCISLDLACNSLLVRSGICPTDNLKECGAFVGNSHFRGFPTNLDMEGYFRLLKDENEKQKQQQQEQEESQSSPDQSEKGQGTTTPSMPTEKGDSKDQSSGNGNRENRGNDQSSESQQDSGESKGGSEKDTSSESGTDKQDRSGKNGSGEKSSDSDCSSAESDDDDRDGNSDSGSSKESMPRDKGNGSSDKSPSDTRDSGDEQGRGDSDSDCKRKHSNDDDDGREEAGSNGRSSEDAGKKGDGSDLRGHRASDGRKNSNSRRDYGENDEKQNTEDSGGSTHGKNATPTPLQSYTKQFQPDVKPAPKESDSESKIDVDLRRLDDVVQSGLGTHVDDVLSKELISKELAPPKVNWKQALRIFFAQRIHEHTTYTRPSRRRDNSRFIFPSRNSVTMPDIAICCDTSGSMAPYLPCVTSEIFDIIGVFPSTKVHLIMGDTTVRDHMIFGKGSRPDPNTFRYSGMGGTEIAPLFKRAEEQHVRLIIAVTDLLIPKWPRNPNVPVLWVVPLKADDERANLDKYLSKKGFKIEMPDPNNPPYGTMVRI